MITAGAKLWLGVAAFAAAALVGWQAFSGGEERGALVLLALLSAGVILGTLAVLVRDGDVPASAAPGEAATAVASVPLPAPWPAIGALGVAVTIVGLAAGGLLLYVGFGIVAVAVVEWMVQGWAERATPDPEENAQLRNRMMYPVEIPVLGLLIVGLVLLAFSRVLLALPATGATVTAIAVAITILLVATLVATRPRISSTVLTVVLVLGAVALLGGGIVGAVAGEREVDEHEKTSTERPVQRQEPTPSTAGGQPGPTNQQPGP